MSDNPVSSITDFLFVYGTLMQRNRNEFALQLHQYSSYIGKGCFPGRLYQIDWFPGAVHDPSASTSVWGEVYQLQHSATLLPYLDAYEGVNDDQPPFVRSIIAVTLANRVLPCHTYLYNLSTTNMVLIESGRFSVDSQKTKK